MIGELSSFMGLQITQSSQGVFISQSKYLKENLKKLEWKIENQSVPIEKKGDTFFINGSYLNSPIVMESFYHIWGHPSGHDLTFKSLNLDLYSRAQSHPLEKPCL